MIPQIYLVAGAVFLLFSIAFYAIKKHRKQFTVPTSSRSRLRRRMPNDRRNHPRFETSLRISYKTPIEEGISWVKDISRGGIRLFLDKTLEIGTLMHLEIKLPYDRRPVLAQSSVVWKDDDDAGLVFDDVNDADLDRILEYIDNKKQISLLNL